MKKKAIKNLKIWGMVSLILVGLFVLSRSFFGSSDLKQAVLGDSDFNGEVNNHDNKNYKNNRGGRFVQQEQINREVTVTRQPLVTVEVTIPVVTVTIAKVTQPPIQDDSRYKTEKVVDLVSVTERSVTTNSNYFAPVVTKSVLKVIKNKIEQVGRGEILSKPILTPTPKVATFGNTESEDVLSGNVDVFYKLLGDKVLLGAENESGRQLKIKDEDLRSAEITLNKVLDKKNLRLSVTGDGGFALVEGSVIALTNMPVHVNIDSHKIYLEAIGGKKELKILPEQAVKQAVEINSFEKLSADSAPSVEDWGDELAYKVVGDKSYKVFGYFNVVAKQNVYITAETGEVIEGEQPLLTKIVRLISL